MNKFNMQFGRVLIGAALVTLAGVAAGFFNTDIARFSESRGVNGLVLNSFLALVLQSAAFAWVARSNKEHPVIQSIAAALISLSITLLLSSALGIPDAPGVLIALDSAIFGISMALGMLASKALRSPRTLA